MIDVVGYLNSGVAGLAASPEEKENTQELGKDAFMQLLITQMTHQNPLEPMENTEFIAQLAQFSSLELMQNMATGMELLALTQTAATNSQMVNLIGKRVITPGSGFTMEGENSVKIKFELDGEVVPVEMIIKNSNGDVVRQIQLTNFEAGMNEFEFDGKDNDGNFLEPGNYSYEIVTYDGEPVEGLTTYANYLVDSVAFEGTSIFLKSKDTILELGDVSEVISN